MDKLLWQRLEKYTNKILFFRFFFSVIRFLNPNIQRNMKKSNYFSFKAFLVVIALSLTLPTIADANPLFGTTEEIVATFDGPSGCYQGVAVHHYFFGIKVYTTYEKRRCPNSPEPYYDSLWEELGW